jgi:hypothetical protein
MMKVLKSIQDEQREKRSIIMMNDACLSLASSWDGGGVVLGRSFLCSLFLTLFLVKVISS